jgi:hypothetical protein
MLDLYTKTALTTIAECLVVIAFRGQTTGETRAQTGPVRVVADSVDTFAFQFSQPLAVRERP